MVQTLVGIGSLVSEASARNSFAFTNFRIGEVAGWRRCFNQANWVNVRHGWGSVADGDVGALAMIPASPEYVSSVALLDVTDEELLEFTGSLPEDSAMRLIQLIARLDLADVMTSLRDRAFQEELLRLSALALPASVGRIRRVHLFLREYPNRCRLVPHHRLACVWEHGGLIG